MSFPSLSSLLVRCLVLLSFYFCRLAHARALHSFPTRRSSDLIYQIDIEVLPVAYVFKKGHRLRLELANSDSPATDGDRKSTRLNSSHRCISYAVFCLKKKTLAAPSRWTPWTLSVFLISLVRVQ